MKFNRQVFFDSYRSSFGSLNQGQASGLEALLSFVESDNVISSSDSGLNWFAYMLATVKHECADTYEPIQERGEISYFDKYEPGTSRGISLGNTNQGDGYLFRGRGYVQITGRANYQRLSNFLGLTGGDDLIVNPDRALSSDIAYKIMSFGMINGSFTGKKLDDYINPLQTDYFQARRIINALDHAGTIAGYAVIFESSLKSSLLDPLQSAVTGSAHGTGDDINENISNDEKDKLFKNNVLEIDKMNVSAGSMIKDLMMELERDDRNTYIKLHDAVPGGHIVHYDFIQGDPGLVFNIAHALGFKNVTSELLEVRDA